MSSEYPATTAILAASETLCATVEALRASGPFDQQHTVANFQLIANFARARVAFHEAMGARPRVSTDMCLPQEGDINQAGARLQAATALLATHAGCIAMGGRSAITFGHGLPAARNMYVRMLEEFGRAICYPVYDPGALSYNQDPSLVFFD